MKYKINATKKDMLKLKENGIKWSSGCCADHPLRMELFGKKDRLNLNIEYVECLKEWHITKGSMFNGTYIEIEEILGIKKSMEEK